MNRPPLKIDTRCACGWKLPLSVMPYRDSNPLEADEDNIVPGVFVGLVCPECHRGHSFFQTHQAGKLAAAQERTK